MTSHMKQRASNLSEGWDLVAYKLQHMYIPALVSFPLFHSRQATNSLVLYYLQNLEVLCNPFNL